MGISAVSTPSKRLMRERSSPGIRRDLSTEAGKEEMNLDPNFNDIYKSVERLGGIGSSKSALNFGQHNKATSVCSQLNLLNV